MYSENQRIIITGGPGSGKSTLLNSLRAKGYPTAAEAGRAIIRNGGDRRKCAATGQGSFRRADAELGVTLVA